MLSESVLILERNKHHWEMWSNAMMVRGLSGSDRSDLLSVYQQEFNPGYTTDLDCQNCVIELLKLVYTSYEKFKSENNGKRKNTR
jgi:hypothetical protein